MKGDVGAIEQLSGACVCGAVRYVAVGTRNHVYACHCTECQTRTGSAFGLQLPVEVATLQVDGALIERVSVNASGARAAVFACARCLTRIHTIGERRASIALLRAGTLDRRDTLTPAFHMWVRSKQPWIVIPTDVPAFTMQPAPEEWRELLTRKARADA